MSPEKCSYCGALLPPPQGPHLVCQFCMTVCSAPDPETPAASDPGWGGPEVAVADEGGAGWGGMAAQQVAGGVPTGAPLPEVEALAQAPYRVDRSSTVVDVHPSGELLLAAGDGLVELRHASNGQRYAVIATPDAVLSARFSPDGHWLLAGGFDGRVSLYEVRTAQDRGVTPPMDGGCDEVAWLGGTGLFVAASDRGEVRIVDARTMAVTGRLLGPDPDYHQLGGIAVTPDGRRLFVSVGSRLGAFDTETKRILWRIDDAGYDPWRLAVSPEGDLLVAAGIDGVALFEARTGLSGPRYQLRCARSVTWPERSSGLFGKLRGDDEPLMRSWSPRPRFSPAGDLVVMQDHVGNLAILEVGTGALHPLPREPGRAWIEDLAWFGDSNQLALAMSDNSLAVWRLRPMTGVMRCEAIGELPPDAWATAGA